MPSASCPQTLSVGVLPFMWETKSTQLKRVWAEIKCEHSVQQNACVWWERYLHCHNHYSDMKHQNYFCLWFKSTYHGTTQDPLTGLWVRFLVRKCANFFYFYLDPRQNSGSAKTASAVGDLNPHNRPWRPVGCEMLRIPHCLDSRLTDGGKAVSPTHRPCSIPQKQYFSVSGTHFC
jgi:hypothetical protein